MSNLAIWALICLVVALILLVMEFFIPSGGLIGFLAGASCVTGIVLLFKIDTTLGLIGALVSVISVPFFMAAAIYVWPRSPIANLLTLKNIPRPGNDDQISSLIDTPPVEFRPNLNDLGKAITDMRPVGTCVIQGRRTECLAETGMIKSGQQVRVVFVDGMTVKVREVES